MSITLDDRPNFALTTIAAGISDVATTVSLTDDTDFETPTNGYNAVIWSQNYANPAADPNREIVRITAKPSDYTITRGQEGTSGVSHSSGDYIMAGATAKMFDDIETELNGLESDWSAYYAAVFNVKDSDYGAVGDGATDDTTAIQDCIDACEAAGGGTVVFPPGTYIVNGTQLEFDGPIRFQGYAATIKLEDGSYSSNKYFFGTRTSTAYNAGNGFEEKIVFDGLTFDGNDTNVTFSAGGTTVLLLQQVNDCVLRNIHIHDIDGDTGAGIAVRACYSSRIYIENCNFDTTNYINTWFRECREVVIQNSQILDADSQACIYVDTDNTAATYQDSQIIIRDSKIENTKSTGSNYCISLIRDIDAVISSCDIYSDNHIGIYVDTAGTNEKRVTVKNCNIHDCDDEGIYVVTAGDKIVNIEGNTITGCDNAVYSDANGVINICNNVLKDSTTRSLYVDKATVATITGNHIEDGTNVNVDTDNATDYVSFVGNTVTGQTSASYAVAITGSGTCTFSGNLLDGNTSDKPYITALMGSPIVVAGSGAPESSITAPVGSLYQRSDGGSGTSNYIKESGVGNTGWTAITATDYVYNVIDYGAAGNGVADDTAEIQAAIDAAEAAGGGQVVFPEGTYLISSVLTVDSDNVSLVGVGYGASKITTSTVDHTIIHLDTVNHCQIRDLQVDNATNSSSDSYGIRVEASTHITIERVFANDCGDAGIRVDYTQTGGGPYSYTDSEDILIKDCYVYAPPSGNCIDLMRVDRVQVVDCRLEDANDYGISAFGCYDLIVSGCTIFDPSDGGIKVRGFEDDDATVTIDKYAYNTVISNNSIGATSFATDCDYGILTGGGVVGLNVTGNVFKRDHSVGNPASQCIYLWNASTDTGYEVDGANITGNFAVGPWGIFVYGNAKSRKISIVSNVCEELDQSTGDPKFINFYPNTSSDTWEDILIASNHATFEDGYGVDISGTLSAVSKVTIINNQINCNLAIAGINIATSAAVSDLKISGNVINDATTGILLATSAHSPVEVIGNEYISCTTNFSNTGGATDVLRLERDATDTDSLLCNNDLIIGDGTYNGQRLRLGNYRVWFDTNGDLRVKSSDPSSATDGDIIGGPRLTGSTTWNPGSIADGDGETSSGITVTGAAFGDFVMVAAPYDLQDLQATAYVQAADTVEIRVDNNTGGAVDLGNGTWRVEVIKTE